MNLFNASTTLLTHYCYAISRQWRCSFQILRLNMVKQHQSFIEHTRLNLLNFGKQLRNCKTYIVQPHHLKSVEEFQSYDIITKETVPNIPVPLIELFKYFDSIYMRRWSYVAQSKGKFIFVLDDSLIDARELTIIDHVFRNLLIFIYRFRLFILYDWTCFKKVLSTLFFARVLQTAFSQTKWHPFKRNRKQSNNLFTQMLNYFIKLNQQFLLKQNTTVKMGCNQVASAKNIPATDSSQKPVPCTVQQIGRYLNDARANPHRYAKFIEEQLGKFLDQYTIPLQMSLNYRTNQGKSAWKEAIEFLNKQNALPPMQKHQGLCKAAELHAIDLANKQQITHQGSDGSNPLQRIQKFCNKTYGKSGENIGTDFALQGRNFAENTIVGLIIDDGIASRGHRNSIFDHNFKYFGSSSRVQNDKVITVITYLSQNWEAK